MHQPTLTSPCLLADPCPTCALHQQCRTGNACSACRRGKPYQCERESPAPPAFTVKLTRALEMVFDGSARFIHGNTALQLNYAEITHLRDLSCKVDEHVIFQYASGSRRARLAVDLAWCVPPEVATFHRSQFDQWNPGIFRYYY
jgi:hypothetical protein